MGTPGVWARAHGQALRGWFMEVLGEKLPEGSEKEAKINDAKTFYTLASLSKVWVLLLISIGTPVKPNVGSGLHEPSTAACWLIASLHDSAAELY
ncbi:hypothetical protein [Pelagibius sp.]|uniref:hypothetical protein n=1 Tax=Pelagibius sp. TaxID=1931238 RepID=UPI002613BCE6|nr:hypothetical protein [Pelagibius sp.]